MIVRADVRPTRAPLGTELSWREQRKPALKGLLNQSPGKTLSQNCANASNDVAHPPVGD